MLTNWKNIELHFQKTIEVIHTIWKSFDTAGCISALNFDLHRLDEIFLDSPIGHRFFFLFSKSLITADLHNSPALLDIGIFFSKSLIAVYLHKTKLKY